MDYDTDELNRIHRRWKGERDRIAPKGKTEPLITPRMLAATIGEINRVLKTPALVDRRHRSESIAVMPPKSGNNLPVVVQLMSNGKISFGLGTLPETLDQWAYKCETRLLRRVYIGLSAYLRELNAVTKSK